MIKMAQNIQIRYFPIRFRLNQLEMSIFPKKNQRLGKNYPIYHIYLEAWTARKKIQVMGLYPPSILPISVLTFIKIQMVEPCPSDVGTFLNFMRT